MLALGLYGSAYGIDLVEAREHFRLIVAAVTIGVFLKAATIGSTMWIVTGRAEYMIIGIAVAQIDPLSVASILGNSRMSTKAKSILAAWASFDDPITALLTVYGTFALNDLLAIAPKAGESVGWSTYFVDLGMNLVLIGAAIAMWTVARRSQWMLTAGVGGVVVIAVDRFLMLGVATSGLFLRPRIGDVLARCLNIALCIAAVMLGMVLIDGVNVVDGILLGLATFLAQIVVGLLLTRRLDKRDRLHLAFAQQNGLTAIVLALLLEVQYGNIVEVVAPAILTVNVIHAITNAALERVLGDVTTAWQDL